MVLVAASVTNARPPFASMPLGAWSVPGPPAGSPAVVKDWARTGELFRTYGAVTTDDTVLLGFGLEHVTAAADRTALIRKALAAVGG